MPGSARNHRKAWFVPMATLTAAALLVFAGLYLVDHFMAAPHPRGPFGRYFDFDPISLTDAVSSLAGMTAAVFGIVITVVSIIVQLSAERYTGVARMFLRDRMNLAVMGYYVIACVCGVWLSVALKHDYVPRAALVAMLAATTFGLVLMGPYFRYVFWFLEPMNIISRIRIEAVATTRVGTHRDDGMQCAQAQAAALSSMEELTDITSNSISGKDKIIASGAVDALKDLTLEYLKQKPNAAQSWFKIGSQIRQNPDFVAMDPESL